MSIEMISLIVVATIVTIVGGGSLISYINDYFERRKRRLYGPQKEIDDINDITEGHNLWD